MEVSSFTKTSSIISLGNLESDIRAYPRAQCTGNAPFLVGRFYFDQGIPLLVKLAPDL